MLDDWIMKRTRVILADGHTLVLEALKNLLEPEFEVLGIFTDGHALVKAAPKLNPDVVILDIEMPTMNGLNAGQRLKYLMPSVKLIYLSMNQDPDIACEALRLGASAYLVKNSSASELVHAIHEVARGGSYFSPLMMKGMLGSFIQDLKPGKSRNRLTLRQKEVLQLLAEGRSMKEAAYKLNVTPRTIAFHKYRMMAQLRIKSSAELIQFAVKNSIAA
jgi:DNA-binding NarL/FixJ family response regulator